MSNWEYKTEPSTDQFFIQGSVMMFKLCFVLCFIALKDVTCFQCPSVTETMANTCINDDPKCSAVPIENGNCFSGCNIICSDIIDETRCASPTEADVNGCNDFGDPFCSAFAIVEEVKGRRCFKGCVVACS